jgi:hypothetical protein
LWFCSLVRGKIDFSYLICCWATVERTAAYVRGDRCFVAGYGSRRPWRIGGPPPCSQERRAASPPQLIFHFSLSPCPNLPYFSPQNPSRRWPFFPDPGRFRSLLRRQLSGRARPDLLYIADSKGDHDSHVVNPTSTPTPMRGGVARLLFRAQKRPAGGAVEQVGSRRRGGWRRTC